MSDYHISDADIDAVVRYLEIYHPKRANRKFAQALLESFQTGVHEHLRLLAQDPLQFETFVEEFEASLKKDQ